MARNTDEIINSLTQSIDSDVGNSHDSDIDVLQKSFDDALNNALKSFNSSTFDDDGFIKRMRDLQLDDKKDKESVKHVLNNVRSDYINVDSLNQSELLLRRDIYNICTQMPEMHDVINVVRDSIIECNVATGEVSRTLLFENHDEDEALESQVKDIEKRHDLQMAIKNFIIPKTLMHGEMYIHVVPYAKLFAEIEALKDSKVGNNRNYNTRFRESVPNEILESFNESVNLYSDENIQALLECVSPESKSDNTNMKVTMESKASDTTKEEIKYILENITVSRGASELMTEYGPEGFKELIMREYKESTPKSKFDAFMEGQSNFAQNNSGLFKNVDVDGINFKEYKDIKGCYVKYLDGLKMVPIRIDRRVIGYYYITTTCDLQTNAANPNGIIDLSYQTYMRDRNMVDQLASMIIKSFDKKMLEKNIKLKNEIAEIVMAHKFNEGRLSFIYIPEDEIVRLVINEDEDGKGHSILEPSLFSARMYLMLTMYNMLYTLNNTTTRVHYLKSSGLNKDYSAQIQRTMRKFQSRRISIDDIYSYSGVLNKIGGMGEMVLPAGRNDFKALETDTIEAVPNPINIEFLEQQRRQAISGTGAPHLLVINAIDEVDFAKTLEMANARFLSTVSSYKIDFNKGITKFYQKLMKYSTTMEDDVINSFRFKFNPVKQQEVSITSDMIQNYENIVEVVKSVYYNKADMEDEKGNSTPKQMFLRRKLAQKYLAQLEFDELDEIVKEVNLMATDTELTNRVKTTNISKEDLKSVDSNE